MLLCSSEESLRLIPSHTRNGTLFCIHNKNNPEPITQSILIDVGVRKRQEGMGAEKLLEAQENDFMLHMAFPIP